MSEGGEAAARHESLLLEHGDVAVVAFEPRAAVDCRGARDRERGVDGSDAGVDCLRGGQKEFGSLLQGRLASGDRLRPRFIDAVVQERSRGAQRSLGSAERVLDDAAVSQRRG